jgi:hypothetical protein
MGASPFLMQDCRRAVACDRPSLKTLSTVVTIHDGQSIVVPGCARFAASTRTPPPATAHVQDRWRDDGETGAANDEVFTLAIVHFRAAGAAVRF